MGNLYMDVARLAHGNRFPYGIKDAVGFIPDMGGVVGPISAQYLP